MIGVEKMQQYVQVQPRSPWGLNKPTWMISPNCVNLIRELKKLRWATYDSTKMSYDRNKREEIHKKDDHAADSVRYFFTLMPDLVPLPPDHAGDALVQLPQALGERLLLVALDHAAGDEGQLRPLADDDAPAGLPETGIEAENTNRIGHRRRLDDFAMSRWMNGAHRCHHRKGG